MTLRVRGQAIACLPVALALAWLAAQGIPNSWPTLLLTCIACAYVVIATGQLALRAIGAVDLSLAAAWTLGIAILGPSLYLLQTLIPMAASTAFAIWSVAVVSVTVLLRHRAASVAIPDGIDLAGLVLCCLFTVAWCRATAGAPIGLAATGQLPAWMDHYLHAGVLSSFGDPLAIGRGIVWLADVGWFPYHYASYPLAAAFAVPLDQPGLPLSTSIWVPIGFLTMATGAYALGSDLARGPAGGVAALIALFVVPDASNYWLRNGYFSFHWNVFAQSGATYALGAAFLSIVLLRRWSEARTWRVFAASAFLVAATLLFRMHLALLLLPTWAIVVALLSRHFEQRRALFLAAAGAILTVAALGFMRAVDLDAEGFLSFREGRALERAMVVIHRRQEPTAYQGLYLQLQNEWGEPLALAAGALLILPALLGVFLVLLPLTFWLERARISMHGIDAVPFILFVPFVVLLLFAPIPTHQDPTDLIHRPTILIYCAAAIWTAALLVRWLSAQGAHGANRIWQTLAFCAAASLPFIWIEAEEMSRAKPHWARATNHYPVSAELRAAAAALRERSRPGDTFATSAPAILPSPLDVPTVLVAMSGLPCYLARIWIHRAAGGMAAETAGQRYISLAEIERLTNPDEATRRIRELGIRWYVATTPDNPRWDPRHTRAMWRQGQVAIYDLTPRAGDPVGALRTTRSTP